MSLRLYFYSNDTLWQRFCQGKKKVVFVFEKSFSFKFVNEVLTSESSSGRGHTPTNIPDVMNGKGGKTGEATGNGRSGGGANNDGTDREMASELEDLEGEDDSSDEDEEANADHHVSRPC